ncbi:Protein R03G8.3, partial [Aphelenchoides avenae]
MGITKTKQGEIEVNNPALAVVVPENLRSNANLMRNLRRNSRQLTTHFDTYATLVNIAREGSRLRSSSFELLDTSDWNATLHGESYLYPFDETRPRNCASQRVPLEYCLCQNREENVTSEKQPLARRIAGFVVDHVNGLLIAGNASQLCAKLSLSAELNVELFAKNSKGLYIVKFETVPGSAKFSASVK